MAGPRHEVYLSCVAYRLGERHEVASLPLSDTDRARLLGPEGGLQYYRVSTSSCLDLASASAQETLALARSRGLPPRVDAVVLASNSLARESTLDMTAALSRALAIGRPAFYFVNTGDCCNFQLAARMCHALVSSGQCAGVLLITVDRVADVCPGQYLAVRGAGVNSDAAGSCLFAREPALGFRISGTFGYDHDTALIDDRGAGAAAFTRLMVVARSTLRALYDAYGLRPSAIGQVITNTYTHAVAEIVSLAARVPLDRVFRDNIPLTGHCFAADNLINLQSYAAASSADLGRPLVLLGSGVYQWSGFVVEATSDPCVMPRGTQP